MQREALKARRVILTGAAGDIGKAIAASFLRAGDRVALIDRDAGKLAVAIEELKAGKDAVIAAHCDIADAAQVEAAIAMATTAFGGVDVLVNNAAAVTPGDAVADIQLADWELALRVNLTAAFLMCKGLIPIMRANGEGVIVNVASQLAHVAAPGRAAYSASKAGLIALTRALAADHSRHGIRAVSVSPGSVMTSRLTDRYGSSEAAEATLGPRHPIGRIGTPQEVAEAILFLCSPHAAFIHGSDVLIDGGYTSQ